MRPAYNFELKYRVTVLTREDWTTGTRTPPMIKGHVWFTDGSQMRGGTRAGVYGQSIGRRLSFSLGKYATVFKVKVFAILACVHYIKAHGIPEKHVRICSDSLVALKALRTVSKTSPLIHQCQEALNDISARHAVGLYWVPGHAGVRGNKTADQLVRNSCASGFVWLELALGLSTQDLRNKISCWLRNQHWRRWQNLGNTQ
jgi:ribonuclease HI